MCGPGSQGLHCGGLEKPVVSTLEEHTGRGEDRRALQAEGAVSKAVRGEEAGAGERPGLALCRAGNWPAVFPEEALGGWTEMGASAEEARPQSRCNGRASC